MSKKRSMKEVKPGVYVREVDLALPGGGSMEVGEFERRVSKIRRFLKPDAEKLTQALRDAPPMGITDIQAEQIKQQVETERLEGRLLNALFPAAVLMPSEDKPLTKEMIEELKEEVEKWHAVPAHQQMVLHAHDYIDVPALGRKRHFKLPCPEAPGAPELTASEAMTPASRYEEIIRCVEQSTLSLATAKELLGPPTKNQNGDVFSDVSMGCKVPNVACSICGEKFDKCGHSGLKGDIFELGPAIPVGEFPKRVDKFPVTGRFKHRDKYPGARKLSFADIKPDPPLLPEGFFEPDLKSEPHQIRSQNEEAAPQPPWLASLRRQEQEIERQYEAACANKDHYQMDLWNERRYWLYRERQRVEALLYRKEKAEMMDDALVAAYADTPHRKEPHCPQCGELMRLCQTRAPHLPDRQFWGCTEYPNCKGTRCLWEAAGEYPNYLGVWAEVQNGCLHLVAAAGDKDDTPDESKNYIGRYHPKCLRGREFWDKFVEPVSRAFNLDALDICLDALTAMTTRTVQKVEIVVTVAAPHGSGPSDEIAFGKLSRLITGSYMMKLVQKERTKLLGESAEEAITRLRKSAYPNAKEIFKAAKVIKKPMPKKAAHRTARQESEANKFARGTGCYSPQTLEFLREQERQQSAQEKTRREREHKEQEDKRKLAKRAASYKGNYCPKCRREGCMCPRPINPISPEMHLLHYCKDGKHVRTALVPRTQFRDLGIDPESTDWRVCLDCFELLCSGTPTHLKLSTLAAPDG